jgi:hypothetical protein
MIGNIFNFESANPAEKVEKARWGVSSPEAQKVSWENDHDERGVIHTSSSDVCVCGDSRITGLSRALLSTLLFLCLYADGDLEG